ncbi:ATP-binding cassette domain-containing protein, partial [Mycobacterium tuberculosis]|nr:ATP-binding cassette domain-containing protein [Mycobacterium tuberculosis]
AQGLSLHLGKRQIIDNVSVALRGGEVPALIGPNASGKSTLLRLLTGYLTPDSGTRHLAGKPLEAWSPEALSRRRAVMLQRTALQADWTVETVIAMGRSPWGATADPAVLAAVMAVTGCDGLAGRRYPGLSGGEQQMLAIARALMSEPVLLMLDEPSLGLAPKIVGELFGIIKQLREENMTVLLVEQNATAALAIADRANVLENGRITLSGAAREMLTNPEIKRMYLGG